VDDQRRSRHEQEEGGGSLRRPARSWRPASRGCSCASGSRRWADRRAARRNRSVPNAFRHQRSSPPHDPRTPAQLRSRARLGAASRKYNYSLTEKQQDACIAAGAKLRSRPRLGQPGPLTGQQYSIRRQYALQKAHGDGRKTVIAPQVLQPQKLKRTTWEPRRGAFGVWPDRRRLRARPSRKPRGGTNESRMHEERGAPTVLRCFRGDTSNPAPDPPAGRAGASP
jgi:hypothetical protein